MVLLASGCGITQSKAFTARRIVDATQSIGGHGIDRLKAIDKLLLTAAL